MRGEGREVIGAGEGGAAGLRLSVALAPLRRALFALRSRDWLRAQVEREARARTAFHAVPLGLMLGIGGLYAVDVHASPWLLGCLALAAVGAVPLTLARPARYVLAILVAATLAGAALASLELSRTRTTVISGSATVRIEGAVEWREADERGRSRYVVRIAATRQPALSRPPERARILVAARHVPIPIGGRFSGLVRLSPPSGPALPGAYDFAFGPYFDGVGAIGFALGAPDPAPPSALRPSLGERLAAARLRLAEHIRDSIGGPEGAVAAALVTGVRAGVPDAIEEDLRITGLAHVLSISGYHMALVAGLALFGLRWLLAAIPAVALRWPVKKIAAGFALLVSGAYLVIAGDNVATDRSFAMLAIMLGAVMLDRPALTLRNVSIAAILVLSLQPHALFQAGFQMSFAATAALVGAYGAFAARERHERPAPSAPLRLWHWAFGLALTSILAGLATAPFGIYHFGRAAPYGLVANLLLMPLFSLWIMPALLAGVLTMPLGLDAPFWWAAGQGLTLVFDGAGALARAFPDQATGRITPAALLVLTSAVLLASVLSSALRWLALPVGLAGLAAAAQPPPVPELLVYEDGRQVALVGADGSLAHLRERPGRFVDEQWRRALGSAAEDDHVEAGAGFACSGDVCRATTRSGLRVAWSENYEWTGELCDTADVAIVARAIRLDRCRSKAALVTLRTLRRTGSLAVTASDGGQPRIEAAMPSLESGRAPDPWNAHRLEPWPESWKRPPAAEGSADAGSPPPTAAGASPSNTASAGGTSPPPDDAMPHAGASPGQ